MLLLPENSFSEENAISDFEVRNHEQNALRFIATWKTLLPASSMVEYREETDLGNWIRTPVCTQQTTNHQVTVVGLQAATRYALRPVSDDIIGSELTIFSQAMPSDFPRTTLTVTNQALSSGLVTITGLPAPISAIVAVTGEGKIVWYHKDSGGGDPGSFRSMQDGRLAYNTYEAIKAVDYRGDEEVLVDNRALGEPCSHDFLITLEGTYMYISPSSVTTNNTMWRTDSIVERDNQGQEVWRWRCADHADQLGGFVANNRWQQSYIPEYGYDWTHANSIELQTDAYGNRFILFSIRNMSRIIKIEYPSGDILWQLGEGLDFTFTGSEPEELHWFLCQHSAKYLSDGSVLLFDNGNDRYESSSDNFSRALMYEIDAVHMTARICWEYDFDAMAEHSGNTAQLSSGNILLVFPFDSGFLYSALIEADESGEAVWTVRFTFEHTLASNILIGLLRISSLYDLATTSCERAPGSEVANDLVIYDNNAGCWYILALDGMLRAWDTPWGWPGALPVPGDYDGDGTYDLALFDDATGCWYIRSLDEQLIAWQEAWGWPGAVPVPGDYDGDGIDDLALFNDDAGTWYILSLDGDVLAWAIQWGWPGAMPVMGDYNADGINDLAVFDNEATGYWYISTLAGTVLAWETAWGWPGAVPVPGDYNGDGADDLALFDSTAGYWFILSLDGELIAWATAWGWPGAVPVPGDYNGDGIDDLALFDDNTGTWYILSLDGNVLAWATAWGWPGAMAVGADGH